MEEKSKHDVHKIQQYFFFRGVPILRHFMSIEVQNSFYPFTTHCGILSSRQDFLLNKKKKHTTTKNGDQLQSYFTILYDESIPSDLY